MNKNLRMVTIVTLLIIMILPVAAIDYPTYKPARTAYSTTPSVPSDDNSGNTTYGGYSTTTSGGVTTYGEGSAIGANGPKRVKSDGTGVYNGEYLTIDGVQCTWNEELQMWVDVDGETHTNLINPSDPAPIGSPLLMLLFAAMAAAVVAWRRKKIAC